MSEAPRTVFASAALRIAGTLTAEVHKFRLGRDPVRVVKVLEPEGPSTAGGKLARLSIVLAPEAGEGKALMCGHVDVGANQAELRSFDTLAEQFMVRHGRPTDIDRATYDRLLAAIQAFLEAQHYSVSISTTAPAVPSAASLSQEELRASSSSAGSSSTGLIIGVGLVCFVLGGIVGFVAAGLVGG